MTFEWDEAKNRLNIEKHGVSFETAARIFDGPVLSWADERKEYGEVRVCSIGRIGSVAALDPYEALWQNQDHFRPSCRPE